jgi:SAM-dependent methyltransferase
MTTRPHDGSHYLHSDPGPTRCHPYLLPAVLDELKRVLGVEPRGERIFDLGCGSGYVAQELSRHGYRVTGVDPSESALEFARSAYPHLDLHCGSAYDDLGARFGRFGVVVSLEVIEHLYDPRHFARTLSGLLRPGGTALVSTPYHGYWKNLAIALVGMTDEHLDPLWDDGHIKFWSAKSLTDLMSETDLITLRIRRVGRIPPLAKSMIAVLRKPGA